MKRLVVGAIVKATRGTLLQGSKDAEVTGISTDSRNIRPGDLFFALAGPNFDGHSFVREVFSKGAACAVVSKAAELPASCNIVKTEDTLKALGDLASYIRGLYGGVRLVAVTGSAGKTTTKEMIASILKTRLSVLKTEGNRNNLIGLPLTISGFDESFDAAVVELGISEPGEMERLANICRPDIAVITNIGRGHLKTLGTIEGVARAKGEIFRSLGPKGIRIVNLDDPWVRKMAGGEGESITFGSSPGSDVLIKGYEAGKDLKGIDASYDVRWSDLRVRFKGIAVSNVINGAAAIAVALAFGVSPDDIRRGLDSFTPVHGRMEVFRVNGLTVIDDTYNANPESMGAALRTLKGAAGRKVAILGDMLELGDVSVEEHRKIGGLAGTLAIDVLVSIGRWSKESADGALASGMKSSGIFGFNNKKDALPALQGILRKGDTVLVKGSRAVGLEEIVEGIKAGQALI